MKGVRAAWSLLATFGLLGCPGEDHGSGPGHGTGTGGACVEDPITIPPDAHPEPAGVFSGIAVEDEGYTRLAVGHVDDDADAVGCCQDYALVKGPNLDTVRIVFGAPGNGLQAFADQADEVVTVTSRMDDIVLADLDDDNRNDIAVVTNSGWFIVKYNAGSSPFFAGIPGAHSGTPGSARAGRSMTALDVNCNGNLDLVAASTTSDHLVVLPNTGTSFGSAYTVPTGSGMRAQRVMAADVNANGREDLVISTDDGRVGVYLNDACRTGTFTAKGPYELFSTMAQTTDMALAAGLFCPGHPNDIAIAVGWWNEVRVMCGDGSGEYDNVLEPHGQEVFGTPADYRWQIFDGAIQEHRMADLQFWSPTRELFLLNKGKANYSEVRLLHPNTCDSESKNAILTPEGWANAGLGSGAAFSRFVLHTEGVGGTEWDRFAVVGSSGLGVGR